MLAVYKSYSNRIATHCLIIFTQQLAEAELSKRDLQEQVLSLGTEMEKEREEMSAVRLQMEGLKSTHAEEKDSIQSRMSIVWETKESEYNATIFQLQNQVGDGGVRGGGID